MTGNYTKGLEVGRIKLYRSASFCLVCPIGQPPRFLCFGGMQSSQEYIKMKPKVKNPTCCWFHSSFKLLPIPKSVFHDVSALILNWKWWHSFRYTILWQIYRLRVTKKADLTVQTMQGTSRAAAAVHGSLKPSARAEADCYSHQCSQKCSDLTASAVVKK